LLEAHSNRTILELKRMISTATGGRCRF